MGPMTCKKNVEGCSCGTRFCRPRWGINIEWSARAPLKYECDTWRLKGEGVYRDLRLVLRSVLSPACGERLWELRLDKWSV